MPYPPRLWTHLVIGLLTFVMGTGLHMATAEAAPPTKADRITKNHSSSGNILDAVWPKAGKKQHKRQRKQKASVPKNPVDSFEKNESHLGPDTQEHKSFAKSLYLRPGQLAEPEKKATPPKETVIAKASLTSKRSGKRKTRRRVVRNAPKIRYMGRGGISLRARVPVVGSDLKFSYRAAGYAADKEGPPHWHIKKHKGFIRVRFQGKRAFKFRAAGAKFGPRAHTYVDLYINGRRFWSGRYIDRRWQWYTIPKRLLTDGKNEIRIVLNGPNPVSIDQILVTGGRPQKAKRQKKGASLKRG